MNNFELRWVGTDPQTRVLQYRAQVVEMNKGTGKISTTWQEWRDVPAIKDVENAEHSVHPVPAS
jgi:hypothetical protein